MALLAPELDAAPRAARARRAPGPRPRLAIAGSRGIPARYGGFETFVEELAPRLVELGIDVTVFCERGSGAAAPAAREHRGVRLEHVPAVAPGPLRTLLYDRACLSRSRGRFDVVYLLGYGAALLAPRSRPGGAELWINMDGLEWRRSKWSVPARAWLRAMEGVACRRATRLVFDSAAVRDDVLGRRADGTAGTKAHVVAYGAPLVRKEPDPAPVRRLGLEPGAYDLVVCRFEPENHVLEIVRAHSRARTERRLAVVADVRARTRYVQRALAAGGERARFLGTIFDPPVLTALRFHARAYLHGHSVGGTNPSLLEAMGCGNVVVSHDNPFNRETLGGRALFFSGEDGLARCLEELERMDPVHLGALGVAARERVAEHYTWERVAATYAQLVTAAAARARAQGSRGRGSRG